MKKALLLLAIICVSTTANAQINIPKDIKFNEPPAKGPIIDKLINEIKTSDLPYQLEMVSLTSSKVTNVNYSNFYGSSPIGKYGTSGYVKLVNGGTITATIDERVTGIDANHKKFTSTSYHIHSNKGKPLVIVKRGRKPGKLLKNVTIHHRDGFDYLIKGELQEKNMTTYYLITVFFQING